MLLTKNYIASGNVILLKSETLIECLKDAEIYLLTDKKMFTKKNSRYQYTQIQYTRRNGKDFQNEHELM